MRQCLLLLLLVHPMMVASQLTSDVVKVDQGSIAVHSVVLPLGSDAAGDQASNHWQTVTVAIASVKTAGQTIEIVRREAGDVLTDDSVYPEEAESKSDGLARLRCRDHVFPLSSPASSIPSQLIALQDVQTAPELQILAQLFSSPEHLNFALVLEVVTAAGQSHRTLEDWSILDECSFELLPEKEQTYQPAGHYADAAKRRLVGTVALPRSDRDVAKAYSYEQTREVVQRVRDYACLLDARDQANSAQAKPQASSDSKYNLEHPVELKSFLELPNFGDMVKPIMAGVLKPVVSPLSGAVTSTLGFLLSSTLGGTLEAGLGDLIPLTLSRSVAEPLDKQVVPNVVEIVTDQIPPLVSENLKEYVTQAITKKITKELTQRLDATVTPHITERVDTQVPEEIDTDSVRILGHILTRSLTQSIVPAMVHTLGHSTLVDYYCYYCYYKETYCEYCQYSPVQLYYTQIYAGYYSTYYSDYYSEYYASEIEMGLTGQGHAFNRREEQQAAGDNLHTGRQEEFIVQPITERNFPPDGSIP